jgi:hypothetical protein
VLEKEDKVSRTPPIATPMKPRLFRLLNAIHRFSVMINPLDGHKLGASCYNRVSRVCPCGSVRIGTRPGVAPLMPASPSSAVKIVH